MGTLWFNGTIYTMEQEYKTVEAVITNDGTIVEVGTYGQLTNQYKSIINKQIDLNGKTMIPGLTDSHMHLIGYGETFLRLDLSPIRSKDELLVKIKNKASDTPVGEWIIGEGFNENMWESNTLPTAAELSCVAPNHPVLLKRTCRHLFIVNELALQLANIPASVSDQLVVTDSNGKLTGVLKESALQYIFDILPEIDEQYLDKALERAIKACWKRGLVGCHTEDLSYYGGFDKTFAAFQQVILHKKLKFRSHLLVHHEVIDDWKMAGHTFLSGNDFLQFGAMKIFVDGALGGRTALLSFPYADDPSTSGVANHSITELTDLIKKARQHELPVATHVIGDLAFEQVLNIIAQFPPPKGTRDRLIHAQILRKELIEKAKTLPVVLDIQPQFTISDFPWVVERIGAERMTYNYAWKTLFDEGLHCAGGSDAPIEQVDPLLGIHAAVTRKHPHDPQQTVFGKEQCLTVYEAVALYTKGAAYAANHEHERGQIKRGFVADFTILNHNIFRIPNDEILKTAVEITIVDGTIVYENK